MKKFMGRTMAKMNENRRNGRKALKGFTLVEIIVVLVILAILAAAMIPAHTGYIDKAKQRTAIAEARNVLTAAQTLASEEYGLNGLTKNLKSDADFKTYVSDKALALADIPSGKGTIQSVKLQSGKAKISSLGYTTSTGVDVWYDGENFYAAKDISEATTKPTGSWDDNANKWKWS